MTKILLVEDNEMNQDMLSRRLLRRGFEVVFATDGKTGVSMASSEQPDLILMDMSLPIMDGWEATRLIKANPRTASIPVIALTAHAMVGDRDKTIAAGCDDYDTKPVELARLLQKIDVLLAKPIVRPEPTPVQVLGTPVQLPSLSRNTPPSEPGAHRILIVDDNDMNRDMLSRRLERAGYSIMIAEGGEAGLALLQQQGVDLILLDIMMPGMSGLEMLQQIRLLYPQAQLPVIMATAKDESEDIVQAFELGANDYVTKPIDLPVLLARIQTHLRTLQTIRQPSPAPSNSAEPVRPTEPIASEDRISSVPQIPVLTPLDVSRYKMSQTLTQDQGMHCYLAEDTLNPDQPICVVEHFCLNPDQAMLDKMAKSIFRTEVDALRKLDVNSPIAKLIDTSWQDQQGYLVREFIEGTPLRKELRSGQPLNLRNILDIVIDLLKIVQFLHEYSIVHQNLQMGSFIRRRSDQRLILADVGLFARLEIALWKKNEYQTSLRFGLTTPHIAPEQLQGSAIFASDIYTIGMIALEALTGIAPDHLPKDAKTGEVSWRHLVAVGGGFDTILDKMICKLTKKRYMSIQRVLDDLYALPMVAMLQRNEQSLIKL
jgi:CheY-like chemotaxis protein